MIDSRKLSKTNKVWNELMFNSQHVVGSVMGIIKKYNPKTIDEFKEFYYKSGEERETHIKEIQHEYWINLDNPTEIREAVINNKYSLRNIFDLNNDYGRTRAYIKLLAKDFARVANLSEEEAFEQVEHRLFYESFKGELLEQKAIKNLRTKYPNVLFRKATQHEDSYYAVDFIGEQAGKVMLGVQVKPCTYLYKEEFQHKENRNKNELFKKDYGAEVVYSFYGGNPGTEKRNSTEYFLISHNDEELLCGYDN